MEIYSGAVIGDIAVDLRYRFNGPGVIAYLRNLCPSMGFVCAACGAIVGGGAAATVGLSGAFANVTFSFFRQWIINCVGRCVMQPRVPVLVSALIIEIVEIIEIICQS